MSPVRPWISPYTIEDTNPPMTSETPWEWMAYVTNHDTNVKRNNRKTISSFNAARNESATALSGVSKVIQGAICLAWSMLTRLFIMFNIISDIPRSAGM